jgi:hypothetical protein
MKKYKNIGTIAIMATLIVNGQDQDIILFPGASKELPSDNLYVSRLVKQGRLIEVDEKSAIKPKEETKPSQKQ